MGQYSTKMAGGLFIVSGEGLIDGGPGTELDTQIKAWLNSMATAHALDFSGAAGIKPMGLRSLMQYGHTLRARSKKVFLIGEKTAELLQPGIISGLFIPAATWKDATKRISEPFELTFNAQALLKELVPVTVAATIKILSGNGKLQEIAYKDPAVTEESPAKVPNEIGGVIDMDCPDFKGEISLLLQKATYLKIYKNLTGEGHVVIRNDMQDGVAEMMNMIFGVVKTAMNDRMGYMLKPAIPRVVHDDITSSSGKGVYAVVPFTSGRHSFYLRIYVSATVGDGGMGDQKQASAS